MLDDILLTMYDGEKMKSNYYDITTARGGKDDSAIESSLINKIDALKAGTNVEIRLSRTSPWKAEEDVDIQNRYIVFLDGQDHTFSPVAIKATVRVLHKYGFRGLFWIKVTRDHYHSTQKFYQRTKPHHKRITHQNLPSFGKNRR